MAAMRASGRMRVMTEIAMATSAITPEMTVRKNSLRMLSLSSKRMLFSSSSEL